MSSPVNAIFFKPVHDDYIAALDKAAISRMG